MKYQIYLMALSLLITAGCKDDLLLENRSQGELTSVLGSKPVLLKLSYVEKVQRRAEFADGEALKYGLTYLEEPKSERKQVYIEVYEDFSVAKQIDYLPVKSDFPADQWHLPADMPDVARFTYIDGIVKGYDANKHVIYEDIYPVEYWLNPNEFESLEKAKEFAVASYYRPTSIASQTLEMAKSGADHFMTSPELGLELTRTLAEPTTTANARTNEVKREVTTEKTYISEEYGVVYRVEGFDQFGELKDLEVNFFTFNEDSVLYMESSHYRNKQYSSAYDIDFLEHSDTIYEDFAIETSLKF